MKYIRVKELENLSEIDFGGQVRLVIAAPRHYGKKDTQVV